MNVVEVICWFIVGACFGSFYHVVGYRLPKNESILFPKHSYCPECGHELTIIDLFPICSFLFGKGRCRYCKKPISIFYPIIEICTGVLFAVSYHLFGYSYSFLVALILSSLLSIVLVSDILYLIIPDEVILVAGVLLFIISFCFEGLSSTFFHLASGVFMFLVMYLLMLIGTYFLKKECLGGADIKLMFISGFAVGPFLSFGVLFLSSVLALPVALVLWLVNREKMIPYGPFIVIAIFIIHLSGIQVQDVLNFLLLL